MRAELETFQIFTSYIDLLCLLASFLHLRYSCHISIGLEVSVLALGITSYLRIEANNIVQRFELFNKKTQDLEHEVAKKANLRSKNRREMRVSAEMVIRKGVVDQY